MTPLLPWLQFSTQPVSCKYPQHNVQTACVSAPGDDRCSGSICSVGNPGVVEASVFFFLFCFNDKILLVTHNLTQNLLRLTESGIKTHLACFLYYEKQTLEFKAPCPAVDTSRGFWGCDTRLMKVWGLYVFYTLLICNSPQHATSYITPQC